MRWSKLEVTKAAEVRRDIVLEIPSDLTRRPYGSSAVDGSDPEKSFVCAPPIKMLMLVSGLTAVISSL